MKKITFDVVSETPETITIEGNGVQTVLVKTRMIAPESKPKFPTAFVELGVVRGVYWDDGEVKDHKIDPDYSLILSTPLWPTTELYVASRALSQLTQLHQRWIGIDDSESDRRRYYITRLNDGSIGVCQGGLEDFKLSFPTMELAMYFLSTFQDLLETAKPLL